MGSDFVVAPALRKGASPISPSPVHGFIFGNIRPYHDLQSTESSMWASWVPFLILFIHVSHSFIRMFKTAAFAKSQAKYNKNFH